MMSTSRNIFFGRADPRWKELHEIINSRSILHGDFTLSSGRKSTYLFQLRQTTMLPAGQFLLGTIIIEIMQKLDLRCVGGMELGAVPIVAAVSFASHVAKYPVDAFFVRKTPKSHGALELIDGHIPEAADVLVLDDVTTTAGSVIKTVDIIEKERRARVRHALSIVDREEGAAENLAARGIELIALFKKSDFLS